MVLWPESNVGGEAWRDRGELPRRHDDAPAEAPANPRERAEDPSREGEAVFDIADFQAIADFAGIRRGPPARR